MRIVLVHPAGSNWFPGHRDITPVANRMAPLGLLSLAAYLERQGHDVMVHDCLGPLAPKEGREANVAEILAFDPELVGFSTTTSAFPDAAAMCELIKAERPEVRTIAGGVHVSSMGAPLLERFPSLDYLCMGEGEMTTNELASGRARGSIGGLIWRDDDTVVTNPPRDQLPELDSLPLPAYHKLQNFPKGYHLPLFNYIRPPGATLTTSRGCLYQCSYCDRSVYGRTYRYNSAEYVYEHMRYLGEHFGVRHINVYDDLFTTHRKRIAELCEMLQRKPLGMRFNCALRVGHGDAELLEMLHAAGCLMVSIGIESGDPKLLEMHKAGVTLDQIRETVANAQATGLRVKGLFMIGLPGETEESIRRTGNFAVDLGLDDLNYAKFTPFPGAPIYQTIHDWGEFDEDWALMNCLNFVFRPRDIPSVARLNELYADEINHFYRSTAWRKKFARRLWQNRHSLGRLVRHMPSFLAAKRTFNEMAEEGKGGH